MDLPVNQIICGDCLQILYTFPSNMVDSVVTDPPYGLSREPDIREVLEKWLAGEDYTYRGGGFMGKTWDSFVPGPSIWREVYRVLKPGGHALVFAGTRTQDLMTTALRLAGFEVRDVIEWLYFSGFPKSMDVSKALDIRERGKFTINKIQHFREKRGLTRKQLGELAGFKDAEKTVWDWEIGGHVPSEANWNLIKRILDITEEEEKAFEREKTGERQKLDTFIREGGYVAGEADATHYDKKVIDITTPATDLAKKWDGWGTALKPAHEPIIVARKPLIGTVAENVEKYGTGALNIDGCRIPTEDNLNGGAYAKQGTPRNDGWGMQRGGAGKYVQPEGRFPANCVTTEPDAFFSKYFNVTPPELCKKASKRDRNSDWRGEEIGAINRHPTVKPTDLMAWLVRLITPPGGIVLDPFAGSGSTCVAARREGFFFIGIEQELEYVEIARKRVCGTYATAKHSLTARKQEI
jgi:site-specific DNA-methyltransferase (adenine-specific)